MRKTVVIDLDGTLSDLTHRLKFLEQKPKDWDGFFGNVLGDDENYWCAVLMECLAARYEIVIVSGRPERTREDTIKWLDQHSVVYNELVLVRKDGDRAPDDLLKEQWLQKYGPENIIFAVDDRQRVVDMWRRNGVICLQCNAWKETE